MSPLNLKIKKSSLVLILFTLFGANYFLFERVLFFNELLSAIGFYFFLKSSFTPSGKLILPINVIYRCVFYYILLGFFYALVSLMLKTNWYYYFRNISIIYSAFSFFIGYHLYTQQYPFFRKMQRKVIAFALLAFGWRWAFLIDRNSYSFLLMQVQKNWRLKSFLALMVLLLIYLVAFTSATVVMIMMALVAVLFIRRYAYFKLLVFAVAILVVGFFVFTSPYLELYKINSTLFGDVDFVYSQHALLKLDNNTSWRLILWYRTLVEAFPHNVLGIGIGTPLLPYVPGAVTQDSGVPDEYWAHVSGLHNTFATVFVRFGILSLVLFGIIYRQVFREYFRFKKYYFRHQNDANLFLGFITLTCVGIFNLLIESPTLASLYWVSLGFVAKAIYGRRKSMSGL
jgi:hypothetical protein